MFDTTVQQFATKPISAKHKVFQINAQSCQPVIKIWAQSTKSTDNNWDNFYFNMPESLNLNEQVLVLVNLFNFYEQYYR